MTIVELEVRMDCAGCQSRVKKALLKLKGVHDVDIDIRLQKVTVMGWVEQKKVLNAVRKMGRRAELWPNPYDPESNGYNDRYLRNKFRRHNHSREGKRMSSYNYYKHGYADGHDHGYRQQPPWATIIDERASFMFSEDNPHFCSVM